ncbi:gametocyte-specific factor 1 homolog isoform X2 [Copidosoma floridanum]|uniref:gametocyte-specific factor 1 homolog isoform X2 n=1 Tax=Copidosoma floridanum TaxID=29053 RepID=UPI000C6F51D1|nr:gametocyte-specific factor 1 homolog isoform X2 [Copidosoma floridanum]
MEYEPYEICPHDKSHQILRSRMAVHLTKCSKNHRKTKKEQCPYDPRHLINPEDYQSHVKTCPAQESVLHHRLHGGDNKTKTINIPPVSIASTAETVMELPVVNWDDDQEVASYNPLRNIEQKEVLRPLLIASKSVKKKFKENERKRMQQLLNENERKENQRREEEKVAAETGVRKLQNKSKVVKKPNVEETAGITGVIKQIEEVQINDKSVAQPEASGKLQTNQSANAEACAYQGAIPKEATNTTSIEDSSTSQQAKESPNSPKKVPFSYATALNRNVTATKRI